MICKVQKWQFDIDDTPCSRKPCEFDEDHLKALLKEESHQTSRKLAKKINCDQKNDSQSSSINGICRKIGSLDAS